MAEDSNNFRYSFKTFIFFQEVFAWHTNCKFALAAVHLLDCLNNKYLMMKMIPVDFGSPLSLCRARMEVKPNLTPAQQCVFLSSLTSDALLLILPQLCRSVLQYVPPSLDMVTSTTEQLFASKVLHSFLLNSLQVK